MLFIKFISFDYQICGTTFDLIVIYTKSTCVLPSGIEPESNL